MVDWSRIIVPAVVVLVLGALVWRGVLHAEALLGVVTLLLPSPLTARREPAS